jgi:3-dehydroquinate synthase
VERYAIRHGVAVAIGMVYVAELAALAGRLDPVVVQDHRNLLSAVGLPTSYSRRGWEDVRDAMRTDKKARGDRLRFVVLEAVARPTILEAPDEDLLVAAYRRIAESAAV